jgi:hypothetical protein
MSRNGLCCSRGKGHEARAARCDRHPRTTRKEGDIQCEHFLAAKSGHISVPSTHPRSSAFAGPFAGYGLALNAQSLFSHTHAMYFAVIKICEPLLGIGLLCSMCYIIFVVVQFPIFNNQPYNPTVQIHLRTPKQSETPFLLGLQSSVFPCICIQAIQFCK